MGFLDLPNIRRDCPPIPEQEIGRAMYVAMQTAKALLRDAQQLIAVGSWVRAAGLGVLALDEVGKIALLAKFADAGSDPTLLKKAWKAYRSHPAKSSQTIEPGNISDEAAKLEEQHRYGLDLDKLKQLAFYSNLLTDGRWVVPEQVVTPDHAHLVLALAQGMVNQLLELYRLDQESGSGGE